jgi:DNA-binding CsgD family transcriptional regulator
LIPDTQVRFPDEINAPIGTHAHRSGVRRVLQLVPVARANRPATIGIAEGAGPTVASLLALNAALIGRNSILLAAIDRYVRKAGIGAPHRAESTALALPVSATPALVDPDLTERGSLDPGAPFLSGLTARQAQVLHLVLAEHPSKNIAADLNISQRTVENHRAAIMRRTGATSLPALARMAVGAADSADCKTVVQPCSLLPIHL